MMSIQNFKIVTLSKNFSCDIICFATEIKHFIKNERDTNLQLGSILYNNGLYGINEK